MFFWRDKDQKKKREISPFIDVGFHGDEYFIKFVDSRMKDCVLFIETGANVGSTLAYVARTYPKVQCISCEPDKSSFEEAVKNTAQFSNVTLYNELSQDFIKRLKKERSEIFSKKTLFWLDAHGYGFRWPLKEELDFITSNFKSGYIFVDDFLVPGMDCFIYDIYQEQICSLDFVKDALNSNISYKVYYPNYTEKTSKHHPLVGWGLIEFGHDKEIGLPEELKNKIKGPIHG